MVKLSSSPAEMRSERPQSKRVEKIPNKHYGIPADAR